MSAQVLPVGVIAFWACEVKKESAELSMLNRMSQAQALTKFSRQLGGLYILYKNIILAIKRAL